MIRPYLSTIALAAGLAGPAAAQPLVVTGGDVAHTDAVVTAPLPADAPAGVNVVELFKGGFVPAQVDGKTVTFVMPQLPAGKSESVRLGTLAYVQAPPQFAFVDKPGEAIALNYAGKPVLKYANAPHDSSSKDRHDETFKVFHHVYDPVTGTIELTSGAYPFSDKGKKFPHHRGLFFGWMKIGYGDGKKADVWHGRAGEFTQHEKVLDQEAGQVFGRQKLAISWHGKDGDTFATEERTVTAYQTSGGTLIDWASVLKTELLEVVLDGDPQHAGFHFRAAQRWRQVDGQADVLPPAGRQGRARQDPELAGEQGPRRPAVGRDELRRRRQAVHDTVHGPPGQPRRGPAQRAGLRPVRQLHRVHAHARQAAVGELPRLGPGRRNDQGAMRRKVRRVRQSAEGDDGQVSRA